MHCTKKVPQEKESLKLIKGSLGIVVYACNVEWRRQRQEDEFETFSQEISIWKKNEKV